MQYWGELLTRMSERMMFTDQNAGFSGTLVGVVYGGGIWMIGGVSSRLVTSPNAINWTSQTTGLSNNPTSVHYGNGLWVACSDAGSNHLATSPNGSTWTLRTSNLANALRSVAYNGSNLWATVGDTGILATSPDGITWTSRTSGMSERIYSVAYGGGKWVAGGENGRFTTSTNGTTWNAVASGSTSFGTSTILSIAYYNGLWVAVGGGSKIGTSSDGITWTQQTSKVGTETLYSVAHDQKGLWMAVGTNGSVVTSPDGTTWTARSLTESTSEILRCCAYGNNLWVIGGTNNKLIITPGLQYIGEQNRVPWEDVSLLLHFYGANGGTFYSVSSNTNHTITNTGSTSISTAQYRFGSSSIRFPNNASRISIPASSGSVLDLQDKDFTIELWHRFDAITTSGEWPIVIGIRQSAWDGVGANHSWSIYREQNNGGFNFSFSPNGTSISVIGANLSLAANTWYALAITRQGNTFRIFQDGVLRNTGTPIGTSSLFAPQYPLTINGGSNNFGLPGYTDEIRIIKGYARYTSSYTVRTTQFPHGDEFYY